jgi:hypothetical protein
MARVERNGDCSCDDQKVDCGTMALIEIEIGARAQALSSMVYDASDEGLQISRLRFLVIRL